jgi:uncharacterized protein (DUF433 family)
MSTTLNGHIEITPGVCGGRPRIAGHRIRVQDVAIWHQHQGQSPNDIVNQFPQLTLSDVHAALTYYYDHRDEIERQIREDEQFVAEFKATHGPGPLTKKLSDAKEAGDSLSP